MQKRLLFLLKTTLFWILLFGVARLLFEFYNYTATKDLTIGEITLTFLHGFRLDLSMTSYFMLAYGIIMAISVFYSGKYIYRIINGLTYLLLFSSILIVVIDLELFRNWGFRMDATPLQYLNTPGAALSSTPIWATTLFIVFWLILSTLASILFTRFISKDLLKLAKIKWYFSPLLITLTAFYLLSARGTLSEWPIRVSTVAFSTKQFANHASINVVWNFMRALSSKNGAKTKTQLIDNNTANLIFNSIQPTHDSTEILINKKTPNVVIIILESFTSDAITFFGGIEGVTPSLNKLAQEGISFTNFYSTSYRSNTGLMAILAGYPGQHEEAILLFPNKVQNLPSLAKNFKKEGYSTAFYYGGDSDFANLNSFIKSGGYDKLEDLFSFPKTLSRNAWGVHDHEMFHHLVNEIDKESKPFFKVLYTLSSHEPFDVPGEPRIKGNDENSQFLNTIAYSDNALDEFMKTAKTKSWWDNTLFVLTADHSVRFIYNRHFETPRRYAIPMVWVGGALAKDSVHISKIGSQQDIPSTILAQLRMDHSNFKFSSNLLNKESEGRAIYMWPTGFGLKKEKGSIAFDLSNNNKVFYAEGDTTEMNIEARSIFQIYINDFNNKEFDKQQQ